MTEVQNPSVCEHTSVFEWRTKQWGPRSRFTVWTWSSLFVVTENTVKLASKVFLCQKKKGTLGEFFNSFYGFQETKPKHMTTNHWQKYTQLVFIQSENKSGAFMQQHIDAPCWPEVVINSQLLLLLHIVHIQVDQQVAAILKPLNRNSFRLIFNFSLPSHHKIKTEARNS